VRERKRGRERPSPIELEIDKTHRHTHTQTFHTTQTHTQTHTHLLQGNWKKRPFPRSRFQSTLASAHPSSSCHTHALLIAPLLRPSVPGTRGLPSFSGAVPRVEQQNCQPEIRAGMACLAVCIFTTHQHARTHVLMGQNWSRITLGTCNAHGVARALALALAYAGACGKASTRRASYERAGARVYAYSSVAYLRRRSSITSIG